MTRLPPVRDGRMAPPGVEQKNDTKQKGKMSSDQILDPKQIGASQT
jgi:hypothetical protein